MHLRNIAVLFVLCSSTLGAYHPIENVLRQKKPSLWQLENAIARDSNPGFINENGETYLHLAAKRNFGDHINLLMQVEEIGNLYLHRNNEGKTAIEIAIGYNNLSAFDALTEHLREDDDIRIGNPQQWSLLHLAAHFDHAEMIVPLVAKIPVNTEDERGWSALDIARLFFAEKAEQVLLEHGALSTNEKDLEFAHLNALENYNWAHRLFLEGQRNSYEIDEFEEELANPLPPLCDVINPLQMSGFWPKTYCKSSSTKAWR